MKTPNTSVVLAAMHLEVVGEHLRALAEAVQDDPELLRQVNAAGEQADALGAALERLRGVVLQASIAKLTATLETL